MCFLARGRGTRWSTACSPQGFGFLSRTGRQDESTHVIALQVPGCKGCFALLQMKWEKSPRCAQALVRSKQGAGIAFAVNLLS